MGVFFFELYLVKLFFKKVYNKNLYNPQRCKNFLSPGWRSEQDALIKNHCLESAIIGKVYNVAESTIYIN